MKIIKKWVLYDPEMDNLASVEVFNTRVAAVEEAASMIRGEELWPMPLEFEQATENRQ
jgi:hypothetical protein